MQRASFHNLQDLLAPSNQGTNVRARRVSGDSEDSYTSGTNKRRYALDTENVLVYTLPP